MMRTCPSLTHEPRAGRVLRSSLTCRGQRSRHCGGSFVASSLHASARPHLRRAAASPPHAKTPTIKIEVCGSIFHISM